MQTYTHIFIFSDNETAFYDKSRKKKMVDEWWGEFTCTWNFSIYFQI